MVTSKPLLTQRTIEATHSTKTHTHTHFVLMDSRELRDACTECEAETLVASILRIRSDQAFKATQLLLPEFC